MNSQAHLPNYTDKDRGPSMSPESVSNLPSIQVWLYSRSDAFNMGQLAYYFLMTGSIYSYITLENPYDRDLINEIKGSLTYDDIVGE